MDFLKEIVKEIGDDFTQLAQDIDGEESFTRRGFTSDGSNLITRYATKNGTANQSVKDV